MVYMPPGIRLAVKNYAAETKVSASDVFVSAVRDYLAVRGVQFDEDSPVVPDEGAPPAAPVGSADFGAASDRQARLIEELLVRLDEAVSRPAPGGAGGKSVGTTVARGMTVMLATLRAVGDAGLDNAAIRTAMTAGGISSGSTETAKAVLRDAGIIRQVDRKWVLAPS